MSESPGSVCPAVNVSLQNGDHRLQENDKDHHEYNLSTYRLSLYMLCTVGAMHRFSSKEGNVKDHRLIWYERWETTL